jgi:competence protein ComEA
MIRMLTALAFVLMLGAATAAQEGRKPASSPPAPHATAVNLNTANASQLEGLPGIGKSVAERIIEYRQKNGGFKKVEDLMNVRGIGEKSFLKLKPLVTVAPAKQDVASAP